MKPQTGHWAQSFFAPVSCNNQNACPLPCCHGFVALGNGRPGERAISLARTKPPGRPEGRTGGKIRSEPVKACAREAPQVFGCDNLMRPLSYSAGELAISAGGQVVFDRSTGPAWQASGTADPLDWESARKYIAHLNAANFGGCSRWRLPTIEEFLSIVRPPGLGIQDCLSPAFDRRQKMLWSCDRCTFTSAWHLDVELGFAGCADFTCHFHARAVTESANVVRDVSEPAVFV